MKVGFSPQQGSREGYDAQVGYFFFGMCSVRMNFLSSSVRHVFEGEEESSCIVQKSRSNRSASESTFDMDRNRMGVNENR